MMIVFVPEQMKAAIGRAREKIEIVNL